MARSDLSTDDLTGRTDVDRTDVDRTDVDRTDVDRTDVDRTDVGQTDGEWTDADRTDADRTDVDRTAVGQTAAGQTAAAEQPQAASPQDAQPQAEEHAPLLDDREADVFLDRWREVQGRFVDDPQGAVRDGDSLVAELMQSLAQRFADQKGELQEQWDRGGEPETEQLRQALQGYRSFFQRLLST